MGFDGPTWTPATAAAENEFKKARGMRGVAVDRDDHLGKFAILLDAIPAGEFGRARIAGGSIFVKIEIKSEAHRLADVVTSTLGNLRSGQIGAAHILWVEEVPSESSPRRALVDIGRLEGYTLIANSGDGIPAATDDEDGKMIPGSATVRKSQREQTDQQRETHREDLGLTCGAPRPVKNDPKTDPPQPAPQVSTTNADAPIGF